MEMQIATNKKMYVIGHYHIAPYRNVMALRRSQTKSDKRVMNVFGSEYGTPSVGAERDKKTGVPRTHDTRGGRRGNVCTFDCSRISMRRENKDITQNKHTARRAVATTLGLR